MDSVAKEQLADIQEKIRQLEGKADQFDSLLELAESEAFEKGLKTGLAASVKDIQGKTIVIFAPEDQHDKILSAARKFRRDLECKIVVLSEGCDLKDLHEIDLKAIGLKRLE